MRRRWGILKVTALHLYIARLAKGVEAGMMLS